MFFPDWTPEVVQQHRDWLIPNHYEEASNSLKLSVHSWLLTVGGKRILIDTCVGNHKPRPKRPKWDCSRRPYLARLETAGATPEQVDMVMCTHLHVDHVGWNTRLENGGRMTTFPNAQYVFSRTDYEHYLTLDRDPRPGPVNCRVVPRLGAAGGRGGHGQIVEGAAALDEQAQGRAGARPHARHDRASSSSRRARRRCSAATSCITRCRCIARSGTASPASRPGQRAQEPARGAGALRRPGALLMPCHFGAPFVCHIDHKGSGFVPRFDAQY